MTLSKLIGKLMRLQNSLPNDVGDPEVYIRGVNDEENVYYCEISTVTRAKQLTPEVEGEFCIKIAMGKRAL